MSDNINIDDRDSGVSYTPASAWELGNICEGCRNSDNADAVRQASWDGTWTTALANTESANITLQFTGTAAYALFTAFTSVTEVSNDGLPEENVARISFYLNGTLVDPSSLPFDYWWYTDYRQDPFLADLVLMAQEDLPPYTHNLTIEYNIDTGRAPQVYLAFDRLEYTPVPGIRPPPSSGSSTPSSLRPTGPSSSGSADPTAPPAQTSSNDPGGSSSDTTRILGLSIGLSVFGVLVIAGLLFWFWRRRRSGRAPAQYYDGPPPPEPRNRPQPVDFPPDPTSLVISPYYTDRHHSNSGSLSRDYDPYHDNPQTGVSGRNHSSPPGSGSFYEKSAFSPVAPRESSLSSSSRSPPSPTNTSSVTTPPQNEKVRMRLLQPTNANEDDLISLDTRRLRAPREGVHLYGMAPVGNRHSTRPPSYTSEPEQ